MRRGRKLMEHERPEDVSPLELWRQREPLPEDLQLPPAPPEP